MSKLLLHEEILLRIPFRGKDLAAELEKRAEEIKEVATRRPKGDWPGITMLIRSKNDAGEIAQLLEDIRANQEYFEGPMQVVLVDTESSDGTLSIVKKYEPYFEVTIVPIKQAGFNYPKSLNLGFEAAKHPLVFTLVGHSLLSNKLTLAAAALYVDRPEFAGGFCYPFTSSNASLTERLATALGRTVTMISRPAAPLAKEIMGMMGANCSVVRREVWQKLGGYDLRYGAGGEDADFGRRALQAGYKIMIDPVLVVHHSHGLGLIGNIRQLLYWFKLGKPLPFDATALARYRKDLGLSGGQTNLNADFTERKS